MLGEMAVGRTMIRGGDRDREFDPRQMLRATVEALGSMDVAELVALRAEAEKVASLRVRLKRVDDREVLALQDALGVLLQSTQRSLRMLRGLHEARVRTVEEAAW